jgi:hypothetical protein
VVSAPRPPICIRPGRPEEKRKQSLPSQCIAA